ncbi:MAG: hypothetical protein GF364_17070 [Candidatus Lokiarchaeota archaeon]|nr:hypothetical protein [Candidatus Lokiarchaeota archaeon]
MIKFKKGIILLALVFCVSLVYGAHTANVELVNYTSFVETQDANFSLKVKLEDGPHLFADINITIPLTYVDVMEYDNFGLWECSDYLKGQNFIINCTNEIRKLSDEFLLNLTAKLVLSDKQIPIKVSTTDLEPFTDINEVFIDLINDPSPPLLSNIQPPNNTFTNDDSILFSIDASDPETGIETGNLSYALYGSNYTNKTLDCNKNNCSTSLDLNYNHGDKLCYYFTIYNKGGSNSTTNISLLNIDKEGPLINSSFLDSINGTNNKDGILEANISVSDEAGIKNCSLIVEGNIEDYTKDLANENLSYDMTSSNDPYNFYIECFDNTKNSEITDNYTIYYDKTAPIISNNQASVYSDSATITFDTNELSNSTINYGLNKTLLDSNINSSYFSLEHSLVIPKLDSSTKYFYQIFVRDRWNNSNNLIISNFITKSNSNSPSGGGGGGGSSDPPCDKEDWNCTEWTSCSEDGKRTRNCEKLRGCSSITGFDPETERTCTYYGSQGESSNSRISENKGGDIFECNDNKDNDGDGLIDKEDPGCIVNGKYVPLRDDEFDEKGFGVTGAAVIDTIKTGSKYATYGIGIIALILLSYYVYKRKRHPKVKKELVDKVLEEGSFKKR